MKYELNWNEMIQMKTHHIQAASTATCASISRIAGTIAELLFVKYIKKLKRWINKIIIYIILKAYVVVATIAKLLILLLLLITTKLLLVLSTIVKLAVILLLKVVFKNIHMHILNSWNINHCEKTKYRISKKNSPVGRCFVRNMHQIVERACHG